MKPYLDIRTTEIIHWFNALRNLKDDERTRALDAFWDTQFESKCWLVKELNKVVTEKSNIYIFGGWIGLLGNLLLQNSSFEIGKVRSIDIDPWCESVADTINKIYEMNDWRFKAVTADMVSYHYQSDLPPGIVINTSSEHIDQASYDKWYERIPNNTYVVVQGNDFFSCSEHIRCTKNLDEFCKINRVVNPLYQGILDNTQYTRFMCIWRK